MEMEGFGVLLVSRQPVHMETSLSSYVLGEDAQEERQLPGDWVSSEAALGRGDSS